MNRRQLLKTAAWTTAAVASAAAARYGVLAPPATSLQRSRRELAAQILTGLGEAQRARALRPYDHPLRQFHNRGLWMGGLSVNAATLGWNERRALTDLVHAGLSDAGSARILSQAPILFTGVNFLHLLLFGDPRTGPWQLILSGIHMNLRLGGADANGVAFGGPQVYGDQRGDSRAGLPGNRFRYQMQMAQELREMLTPAQRAAIRLAQAPAQTCIDLQGNAGRFDGVPVADLPARARRQAQAIVDGIVCTYNDEDAAHAWQCLQHNGGVDALRFADYDVDFQGGRRTGDGPSQIFRLEGPAAVFHFRGEPHVHAFINLGMNGEQPLSVGEPLGVNPVVLEQEELRRFYERAMREGTGADIAHYPSFSVVGRLRAGELHSGDLWAAESWGDELVVCEVRGEDLAPPLARALATRGRAPQAGSLVRVATTGYLAASDGERRIGRMQRRESRGRLRDALVAYVLAKGFSTRS